MELRNNTYIRMPTTAKATIVNFLLRVSVVGNPVTAQDSETMSNTNKGKPTVVCFVRKYEPQERSVLEHEERQAEVWTKIRYPEAI